MSLLVAPLKQLVSIMDELRQQVNANASSTPRSTPQSTERGFPKTPTSTRSRDSQASSSRSSFVQHQPYTPAMKKLIEVRDETEDTVCLMDPPELKALARRVGIDGLGEYAVLLRAVQLLRETKIHRPPSTDHWSLYSSAAGYTSNPKQGTKVTGWNTNNNRPTLGLELDLTSKETTTTTNSSHNEESCSAGAASRRKNCSSGGQDVESPNSTSDPKKVASTFNGLLNQGSTCYLNSLLQALYHLTKFRDLIYLMPINEADREAVFDTKSVLPIPLALQLLFHSLETHESTVSTLRLTKSFGWTATDSAIQQDIHELMLILIDNLEIKWKTAHGEGDNAIKKLFCGTTEAYIEVLDKSVDYTSSRREEYYDLQLVVKNNASLYESLEQYLKPDLLDGNNKYCLERDGKKEYHDAKRGVRIRTLPPVLNLQLSRFDFDSERGEMVKVLSRWEFYEEIDMKPYVHEPSDTECYQYVLHSVLVHAGKDALFGHYYSFVRAQGGRWFKFNDETVSYVSRRDVFGGNFGGTRLNYWGNSVPVSASAYMLFYIRKSDVAEVVYDKATVPHHLHDIAMKEREVVETERKERAEEHRYVRFYFLTLGDIHERPEYLSQPTRSVSERRQQFTPVRVLKCLSLADITREVETATGVPQRDQAFWHFSDGKWGDSVPMGESFQDYFKLQSATTTRDFCLLVTNLSLTWVDAHDAPLELLRQEGNMSLTFHKFYDPKSSPNFLTAYTIGATSSATLASLGTRIQALRELPEDAKLTCLLEIDGRTVVSAPKYPASGEIYVWDHETDADETASELNSFNLVHRTAQSYYSFLQRKVQLKCVDIGRSTAAHGLAKSGSSGSLLGDNGGGTPSGSPPGMSTSPDTISVEVDGDLYYSDLQRAIGICIGYDSMQEASKLRLYRYKPANKAAGHSAVLVRLVQSERLNIRGMMKTSGELTEYCVGYELMPCSVTLLEESNSLSFELFDDHAKPISSHVILFPRGVPTTVEEMISRCLEECKLTPFGDPIGSDGDAVTRPELLDEAKKRAALERWRLFDLWKGKIFGSFDALNDGFSKLIPSSFQDKADYRLERFDELPLSEVSDVNDLRLVDVMHFTRNDGRLLYHSDPISLYLTPADTVASFQNNVSRKLRVPVQTVQNWKVQVLDGVSDTILNNAPLGADDTTPMCNLLLAYGKGPSDNTGTGPCRFQGVRIGLEHAPPPQSTSSRKHLSRMLESAERGVRIYR